MTFDDDSMVRTSHTWVHIPRALDFPFSRQANSHPWILTVLSKHTIFCFRLRREPRRYKQRPALSTFNRVSTILRRSRNHGRRKRDRNVERNDIGAHTTHSLRGPSVNQRVSSLFEHRWISLTFRSIDWHTSRHIWQSADRMPGLIEQLRRSLSHCCLHGIVSLWEIFTLIIYMYIRYTRGEKKYAPWYRRLLGP